MATYVKLVRAAETATARIHRHLADAGLTPSQFGILEALLHLGPLCQKELGKKILKSSGNITLVIDNLEKQGLVRRERSSDDRRYVRVSLTGKGGRMVQELFPRHAQAVTEEMSILSSAEQHELGNLCRILGKQARA